MNRDVVVIGGGTAGMEAAGMLARAGYLVTLLEKEEEPGGHLKNWYHLFPDRRNGEEVMKYLNTKINNDNITFLKGNRIDNIEKMIGNSLLEQAGGKRL